MNKSSSFKDLKNVTPRIASSVAVWRDGRFLLTLRGHPPYKNLYSLPGGKVEWGEELSVTAAREVMEEVGIAINDPVFVSPLELIDKNAEGQTIHHTIVMVHVAHWKSGIPQIGPEALDIRWVTLADLDNLPTTPNLKEMLVLALATLRAPCHQSVIGSE